MRTVFSVSCALLHNGRLNQQKRLHKCRKETASFTQEGALVDNRLRELTNTPPARAVVEGMAGDSTSSAQARPYARPREVLPNTEMHRLAMRAPKPVFSTA